MIFRAQIAFAFDTDFPRDRVVITPHFIGGTDAQGLANLLKANLNANAHLGATAPYTINVYDAEKAPPSYPLATATNGSGHTTTNVVREVSLCLSYFSAHNRPSLRGRLYIPGFYIGGPFGERPSPTQMQNALDWRLVMTTNMEAGGYQWALWSRKLRQASPVTDCWVDDEWDIQRRRGMRGTTRVTATVP
jgi:hypothetical protein